MAKALRTMQGQPRTALLVSGIRQEERIRQDPNLQAERLVKVWSGLEAEHRRLKGWEHDEARGKVETRMKAFVADLKRDPQLESILRNRQQELGVSRGSRLDQVMRERDIDRAMTQRRRRYFRQKRNRRGGKFSGRFQWAEIKHQRLRKPHSIVTGRQKCGLLKTKRGHEEREFPVKLN